MFRVSNGALRRSRLPAGTVSRIGAGTFDLRPLFAPNGTGAVFRLISGRVRSARPPAVPYRSPLSRSPRADAFPNQPARNRTVSCRFPMSPDKFRVPSFLPPRVRPVALRPILSPEFDPAASCPSRTRLRNGRRTSTGFCRSSCISLLRDSAVCPSADCGAAGRSGR